MTEPRDNEAGASVVEYALLIALLALVCLAAVSLFGSATGDLLDRSASSIRAGG